MKQNRGFWLFFILFFVFFLLPSCPPPKNAGKPGEKQKAWALISFTAGTVSIESSSGNRVAEPGQILGVSDVIRTGVDGICDIQLASQALVKLEPSTTLSLLNFFSDSGAVNTALELSEGSILVKVRKLLEMEDFLVITKTGTAGVRGTVFKVTAGLDTVFELAEGSLAILPIDNQTSKLSLTAKETEITSMIEEAAFMLKDSGEITVTTPVALQASQDIGEFLKKTGGVSEAENEALKKLMLAKKQDWQSLEQKPLKESTAEVLDSFAQNAIVTNLDKLDGTEQTLAADFSFKRLSIKTEPEDAWLSVNNAVISNLNPKILVQTGALVSISVGREGYETFISSYKIDSSTPENLVISLKEAEKVMTSTDWANIITQEVYHWFNAVSSGDIQKLRLLWPSMTSQDETGISELIADRVQLSLLSNPVKVINIQKDRLTVQLRYRMKRPEESTGIDFAQEWVYIRDPFAGGWIIESQRSLL